MQILHYAQDDIFLLLRTSETGLVPTGISWFSQLMRRSTDTDTFVTWQALRYLDLTYMIQITFSVFESAE